jgi:hypothetical protein
MAEPVFSPRIPRAYEAKLEEVASRMGTTRRKLIMLGLIDSFLKVSAPISDQREMRDRPNLFGGQSTQRSRTKSVVPPVVSVEANASAREKELELKVESLESTIEKLIVCSKNNIADARAVYYNDVSTSQFACYPQNPPTKLPGIDPRQNDALDNALDMVTRLAKLKQGLDYVTNNSYTPL